MSYEDHKELARQMRGDGVVEPSEAELLAAQRRRYCEGRSRWAISRELMGYDYAEHVRRHDEKWEPIKDALLIFGLVVVFLVGVWGGWHAHGADNGQWNDLPPEVRKWFQSPRIKPCCSLADGTRTDWEIKPDGYYVPVPWHPQGREYWERVPDGAVITDAGNPVGVALIWYNIRGASIRCFVPGGGV